VFYDLMREIKRRKGGTLNANVPGGDAAPRDKPRKKKNRLASKKALADPYQSSSTISLKIVGPQIGNSLRLLELQSDVGAIDRYELTRWKRGL
ncbi:hypothetical protein Tcan_14537, partial [Toxocara canis]